MICLPYWALGGLIALSVAVTAYLLIMFLRWATKQTRGVSWNFMPR